METKQPIETEIKESLNRQMEKPTHMGVNAIVASARRSCRNCKLLRPRSFLDPPPCPDTDGEHPLVEECEADV